MRIAIVHDYLNQFGGAERVISALHEIWPEAPIYTSIYDASKMPAVFQRMDIHTSFMQKIPFVFRFFKYFLILYPLAFESFDLSGYDVILSCSSAWAKGVKKQAGQLHICYCCTPMRFVWRYDDYVKRESFPRWIKSFLPFVLAPIKKWDIQTIGNVDRYVSISRVIQERIRGLYGRESDIIYPPVECDLFRPSKEDCDYFLVVSRLNSYKRIDIVVEAFNCLDIPLKIIGDGPDRKNLERLAHRNIEFLGRLSDAETARHLAACRALIFPGEEDFGIVPVEAMSAGRPVIAYRSGGAVETVREGVSGMFFTEQTAESLVQTIKKFQFATFDKSKIRLEAEKFDKAIFKDKIKKFVEKTYEGKYSGVTPH
ncbi:MAG: glycosyltransferase [Candidatus Margulisiibacteriota bacterium]